MSNSHVNSSRLFCPNCGRARIVISGNGCRECTYKAMADGAKAQRIIDDLRNPSPPHEFIEDLRSDAEPPPTFDLLDDDTL